MKSNKTFAKSVTAAALIGIFAAIAIFNWRGEFVKAQEVKQPTDNSGNSTLPAQELKYYDQSRLALDSGIFSLLPATQSARLHLVRIDSIDDRNIKPCAVEIRIFNDAGQEIGPPDAIELRPGVAVSRAVQPEDATTPQRYRVQIRGVEDPNIRCSFVPTLEVFDRRTGETEFIHPGLSRGFNPQPDPPGHK
jgi:hypothetical protein